MLDEAVERLRRSGYAAVPVLDDDGRYAATLSQRRPVASGGRKRGLARISSRIMTAARTVRRKPRSATASSTGPQSPCGNGPQQRCYVVIEIDSSGYLRMRLLQRLTVAGSCPQATWNLRNAKWKWRAIVRAGANVAAALLDPDAPRETATSGALSTIPVPLSRRGRCHGRTSDRSARFPRRTGKSLPPFVGMSVRRGSDCSAVGAAARLQCVDP